MIETGQIDLARAAPFRLGPIKVEPALRQVSTTTVSAETLEPRVMQVLVVLAAASGDIVSRDELIRQCWEGRIVGEDAINRVISRLRRLADERGNGSFRIETIAKVGYRLIGPVSQVESAAPRRVAMLEPTANPAATPARRPSRSVGLAGSGAALAIVAGLAFVLWPRHVEPPDPAVILETFTVSGSGLPATYAADLRNEIVANRTRTSPIIEVLDGDPSRHPNAFRLSGRVRTVDGTLQVFPAMYAPGSDVPIWTPKYELAIAESGKPQVGQRLMSTMACIVEGATDAPGGMARAAMEPFADYCDANNSDSFDTTRMLDGLRKTVAADPHSALGWAAIAVFLGPKAWQAPSAEAAQIRAEGQRAASTALRLDPANAVAFQALALLTTPTDFLDRDAAFKKAIGIKPDKVSQPILSYGNFLTTVGRVQDTILADRRSLQLQPLQFIGQGLLVEALATSGENGKAQRVLDNLDPQLSDHDQANGLRLDIALWTHDWGRARVALAALPDNPATRAMRPLIDALAGGDKARIAAAGAPFVTLATDPAPINGLTITALALSGHDAQAVAAVERFFHERGPFALRYLYQPPFAHIRTTPEFAALAERLRLIDYWRKSGHVPDFCRSADAPKLCTTLK